LQKFSNKIISAMVDQDNNVSFFRFEDLRIYAKAIEYVTWVQEAISNFPENQVDILGKYFAKSAQGIALNIAEGSSRNNVQFVYYLKIAKSFVRECVVYTEIASKLSILSESKIDHSRCQLTEMTKMIGKFITSLQKNMPTIRDEKNDDFSEIM